MQNKSFLLPDDIHGYLLAHSSMIDDVRRRLIAETAQLGPVAGMQVAPEQAVFITLVTRLIGARRAIEVGTFTGLSALSVALGMPAGGTLICCDVSEEWTTVARRYWAEAGVADRIDLRIGPALDTLRALPPDPGFDLAFIDADKPGYVGYWEELVPRMAPGGLVMVDNVLQGGRVIDPSAHDTSVDAIRTFNDHVVADERVELVMLPISDGLTLARVR